MDQPLHACAPGCMQDEVGAYAVCHRKAFRAGNRPVDVALRCKMHYGILAGERFVKGSQVTDIFVDEVVPAPVNLLHVLQGGEATCVGEGVVNGDLVVGVGQHPAHVIGADEPGTTSHQKLHSPRG